MNYNQNSERGILSLENKDFDIMSEQIPSFSRIKASNK